MFAVISQMQQQIQQVVKQTMNNSQVETITLAS
jgi:hypothetical protein